MEINNNLPAGIDNFMNDTVSNNVVAADTYTNDNYPVDNSMSGFDTNDIYPETPTFNNDHPLLNSNESNNVSEYSNDIEYNEILDFLQYKTGLLELPEDYELTLDNVQEAVEISNQYKTAQIIEQIKNKAGDEYVAELFDIVWEGGTLDDLQFLQTVVEDESELDYMDLDDEDNQRTLISRFLHESLNSNAPTYEFQVRNIEPQVNSIIERYEGKIYAEKAFEYYKELFENAKNQKYNEIQQREQERIAYENAIYQKQQNWNKLFRSDLSSVKWDDKKKSEIIQQFNEVKLTDGSQMPLWKYKFDMIWEKPELTKYFLDFLSSFDEHQLEFKNIKTPKQQVNDTLTGLIKKTKTKTDSSINGGNHYKQINNNNSNNFDSFINS